MEISQQQEEMVLTQHNTLASQVGNGTVSGHALRKQLMQAGWDKRTIATTLGALVTQGRLERVRVNEPSGLFYLAYRRTSPSETGHPNGE